MAHGFASGTSAPVTYVPKPATVWSTGVMFMFCMFPMGFCAFLFWTMPVGLFRFGFGIPLAVVAVLLGLAGAQMCLGAWRGTIGVTITPAGIRQTSTLGTYWAEWSSLEPFVEGTYVRPRGGAMACARARIIGPGVSKNLRRRADLVILDGFTTPIATMIREMNAARPGAAGDGMKHAAPFGATLPEPRGGTAAWGISGVTQMVFTVLLGLGLLYQIYSLYFQTRR
jgi:hypothetical protein